MKFMVNMYDPLYTRRRFTLCCLDDITGSQELWCFSQSSLCRFLQDHMESYL